MSDYKRRNINIDKSSSYARRTGICTEEAALHLMDEIMFLRADKDRWIDLCTKKTESKLYGTTPNSAKIPHRQFWTP